MNSQDIKTQFTQTAGSVDASKIFGKVKEVFHQIVKQHYIQPKQLLQMMRQPIDALLAVHKQEVLHRDITPSNLLVKKDGSIKLIDFGPATELGRQSNTVICIV